MTEQATWKSERQQLARQLRHAIGSYKKADALFLRTTNASIKIANKKRPKSEAAEASWHRRRVAVELLHQAAKSAAQEAYLARDVALSALSRHEARRPGWQYGGTVPGRISAEEARRFAASAVSQALLKNEHAYAEGRISYAEKIERDKAAHASAGAGYAEIAKG